LFFYPDYFSENITKIITLVPGDITKDRGTKLKLLFEGEQRSPVTGLAFKVVSADISHRGESHC
jgi:hypothetical protein